MVDREAGEDIESRLWNIEKSIADLLAEKRRLKEMLRQQRGTSHPTNPSLAAEEMDSEVEEDVKSEEYSEVVPPTLKMVTDHGEAYTCLVLITPECYGDFNGAVFVLKLKKREEGEEKEDMSHQGGIIPSLEPAYYMFDGFDNIPRECIGVYARLFTGKSSKLYLAAGGWNRYESESKIFSGFVFNMENGTLVQQVPIKPHVAMKSPGKLMSAYGNLYFIADPESYPEIEEPSFEKYCPVVDKWEKMPSFTYYRIAGESVRVIRGYAVFEGVILISVMNEKKEFQLFTFHVSREKWSRVKVDTTCDGVPFIGRAVVVGGTLYALSEFGDGQIMAFSFKMDAGDNGDLV